MYLIPKEAIGGGGLTTTRTTFTIGGTAPIQAIEAWMQEPQMTLSALEEKLTGIIVNDWKLPAEKYIINLNALSEYKIKSGWFSRGIYYKLPGQRGYKAVVVSGKEYALALQNFYPNNIG